jgi:predicted enzyme related to lactoylglutathione lyase
MVRAGEGLAKATEFYHAALGLQVLRVTDEWAELRCDSQFSLSLQAVTTEPQVSTGYSPLLNFEVDDMDTTIAKCVQMGGHLDGPIQYPAHGKVAALRTPDGHMIGIYEPAK